MLNKSDSLSLSYQCSSSLLRSERSRCCSDTWNCRWCFGNFHEYKDPGTPYTHLHLGRKTDHLNLYHKDMHFWLKTSTFSQLLDLGTFVERPASQYISSVGEAGPSGTNGSVLRCACFRALLTVDTPGSTHWTAAHVHTVSAWQWLATLILVPLHVALLTTHI